MCPIQFQLYVVNLDIPNSIFVSKAQEEWQSLTVQKLVKELNKNRETVKLILTENTNMKKSLSKNSTGKCLGQARNKKKNLLGT